MPTKNIYHSNLRKDLIKYSFSLFIFSMLLTNVYGYVSQQQKEGNIKEQEISKQMQEKLKEQLEQIIKIGKLADDRQSIKQAGLSKNPKFIPLLKEVAEITSKGNHILSYYALYSLKQLGESDSYFLVNAQEYKSNAKLAYYSILVLAYDPTKIIRDSLEEISKQMDAEEPIVSMDLQTKTPDKIFLKCAIARVTSVYICAEELASIKEFNLKVDILLNYIKGGCGTGDDGAAVESSTIWAEQKLYLLSLENAALVVEVISQKDIFKHIGKDWVATCTKGYSITAYRAYVSQFVSDEAKLLLKKLGEEK